MPVQNRNPLLLSLYLYNIAVTIAIASPHTILNGPHTTLLRLIHTPAVMWQKIVSYLLVTGKSRHPEKWLEANNKIDRFRIRLGNKIAGSIEKRMTKAYPKASFVEKVTKDKTVFAKGCDFYKIVM